MQIPSQPSAGPQPAAKFDESAVLRRIADGDAAALGTLFDYMARPVYSFAAQALRNHDRAEDVVEATFWRAWEESALGGEPDVQSWLLSTAKQLLLEQSPQCAAELGQLEALMKEDAAVIPEHPINPGRAAGIRSRLVSRASAATDYRAGNISTTPASRVKPASAKTTTASLPAVSEVPGEQKRRGPAGGGMGIAAALATVIALGAFIQMLRANSEANSLRATIQVQGDTGETQSKATLVDELTQDKIVAAVTGPDVRVISLTHYGARGAVGRMFWNRETNTWTLVTYSIRQPRPGRIFQVWLSTSNGTLSAGMFTPDASGRAIVQSTLQVGRDELYSVSVTEEPKGGTPAPTGPAVIAGAP